MVFNVAFFEFFMIKPLKFQQLMLLIQDK